MYMIRLFQLLFSRLQWSEFHQIKFRVQQWVQVRFLSIWQHIWLIPMRFLSKLSHWGIRFLNRFSIQLSI
jgi:hypothetical protein